MTIEFTVQPAADVDKFPAFPVTVEINYLRIAPGDDGGDQKIPASTRLELDGTLNGSLELGDADPARLECNILSVDGSSLFKKILAAAGNGKAVLVLTEADVLLLESKPQAIPPDAAPI